MAWKEAEWLSHCDDNAVFLGLVGYREIQAYPDAVRMLRDEYSAIPTWTGGQVQDFIESLDKEGMPTAYLFRCRHCNKHLAYADFT